MPTLTGKQIGPTGYGMMGLTWRQPPPPKDQSLAALRVAFASGMNFWNGGEFYGTPEYNSMTLLKAYFDKYPEDSDKVVISIKGGVGETGHQPDQSPEGVRKSVDNVLKQLGGNRKIDVFEFARRDQNIKMEDSFKVLEEEYVKTGKVGGIALSEVRLDTLKEAVKIIKVVAVEVELSLFSTDVLTNGIAATCAEHNIPIVAYAPIGRGLLTGQIRSIDDLPENSMLRKYPRFQPDVFPINIQLVEQVEKLAKKKGCTAAQLAINWTKAISRRPGMPVIIPIPGATSAERVEENSQEVELTDDELAEIDATLAKFPVAGDRYPDFVPTNT